MPAKQSASSLMLDTVPAVSPHQLPSQQTTICFFVTGTTILWRGAGLAAYAGADVRAMRGAVRKAGLARMLQNIHKGNLRSVFASRA